MIRRVAPPQADRWEDYFEPDERLLWQGTPVPGIWQRGKLAFLTLFGIPFLVVGVLMVASGLRQAGGLGPDDGHALGLFLAVFGLPFAAVGGGLTILPWYGALNAHRRIRYALSDRRAYIAKSWWNHTMQSYPIGPEDAVELEQGPADTVWFHTSESRDSDGDRTVTRAGFENIAEGLKVYELLRRIQRGEL